jgi:hypothetical protein
MNYFAHGIQFIDRPYVLAGTALPDWLSVVDRSVRLRAKYVRPFADGSSKPEADLAAGVLQHFDDDGWFHRTAAFAVTSAELTVLFREALPSDEGHRPAFLGHILTEMLLDAVLIEDQPQILEDYYVALSGLDPQVVDQSVSRMTGRALESFQVFIPLFVKERFLIDYLDTNRLLYRLNQIMRRVKLHPLPGSFSSSLGRARGIVAGRASELLPATSFARRV